MAANDNQVSSLISILSAPVANFDFDYQFETARIWATAKPDLRAVILDTVRQRHIEHRGTDVAGVLGQAVHTFQ